MNDPQQCALCFQPVGPFYRVRILSVTSLDLCGGTATPPHARIAGAQKIACHSCRYTFTNLEPDLKPDLEPCSTEEPADHSEHESPAPTSNIPTPIPTLSNSTSPFPSSLSRPRKRSAANNRASTYSTHHRISHDNKKAGHESTQHQRAPPHYPDTTQTHSSRAPPFDRLS